MNAALVSFVIALCLLTAVFLGSRIQRLLPEQHLNSNSRDAVKLAMGLVATMSALLLSLLVSSAKGAYDSNRTQVIQLSANLALLDRALAAYGPETHELRRKYIAAVAQAYEQMWPPRGKSVHLTPNAHTGDAVFSDIQGLTPRNDLQQSLKDHARDLALDVVRIRTLLLAQSASAISMPLLIMVVSWLVIVFLGFSLLAPRNVTTFTSLVAAAISVSGAMFLILELDQPFTGLLQISPKPMQNTLIQLRNN